MESKFKQIVTLLDPLLKENKFLLALSGGPDSVALFHLLKAWGVNFSAAHCNFQLRGDESEKDQEFVHNLCREFDVPIFIKRFETKEESENSNDSIQMIARRFRYDWFEELLEQEKIDYITTGHHLDDQIETFFLNLFRGTGVEGLSPLPFFNKNRFRPLIKFEKQDLLTYLEQNNFEYRKDASNALLKYDRNKIRHEVLPIIASNFPHYKNRLARNFENFDTAIETLNRIKNEFISKQVYLKNGEERINIESLDSRQKVFWLIQHLSGNPQLVDEIEKLKSSQKGKYVVLNDSQDQLIKEHDYFVITSLSDNIKSFQIDECAFENDYIKVELKEGSPESFETGKVYLDCDKISFPLQVRTWNFGDKFNPFGMKGSKLISDFLTDRKISNKSRGQILVTESENKISSIIGFGSADWVKLDLKTHKTLIINKKY